jgi:small subunit ribosomal protein S5
MQKHGSRVVRKEASEFTEKVIQIDRVNKVVKGGKRLSFRALVIVGDNKGKVGIALGKSREVPSAIRKGIERAKKDLSNVNIVGGTIPHMVLGSYGASKVLLKPAKQGTGVIAGGAVRILLEAAGLKNIVAKSIASGSAINTAKAALNGLLNLKDLEVESKLRGKQLPVRLPVTVTKTETSEKTEKPFRSNQNFQKQGTQNRRDNRDNRQRAPRPQGSNSKPVNAEKPAKAPGNTPASTGKEE